MGAGGRADGQGVGQRRESRAEHHSGRRERRGEPVGRAHAVVAVFGRHRAARVDGVRRGARSGVRSQAGAAGRAHGRGDVGGDGRISAA
jgi:hypothetical protein